MTVPRVSVVIPTRNRADLLPVAIRSVLGQTFGDFEVLLIDDASEDRTREVVAAFSDERLRYLRQERRQGGAVARNTGIRSSRAEFVAFLDDDDEWVPRKLDAQIGLLDGNREAGVVYSSYVTVERETGAPIARHPAEHRGDISRDLMHRNVVGGTSAVVVRRSCLETVGLFDEGLPSFQDYDLWIRLSRRFRFDFVEDDLMKYSVHGSKIWTDFEALDRGIDIMLEKYGSSPDLRRNLASQSLRLGVRYASRGDLAKGRRALRRAIRLAPSKPKPYLNLALSLLGRHAFRIAHGSRRGSATGRRAIASSNVSGHNPGSPSLRRESQR